MPLYKFSPSLSPELLGGGFMGWEEQPEVGTIAGGCALPVGRRTGEP